MTDAPPPQPPGWYHAEGDPPDTQRYWDGNQWQGGPQPAPPGAPGAGTGTGTGTAGGAGDLATPGSRLGARIIDFAIWLGVSLVLGLLFGGGTTSVGTESTARSWFAGLLTTLVVMAYEVWFVANRGGTPGKLVVGLRVADRASRTSPVDYRAALLRVVPIALGIIPLLGGVIGFFVAVASLIMIFTDAQRQTVWDKLAGTVVVRSR